MKKISLNIPVVMGILEKTELMNIQSNEYKSCLSLYEKLTEREWREMSISIIANTNPYNKELLSCFEDQELDLNHLPLYTGGGSWAQHEPMPCGLATIDLLREYANPSVRKKVKVALDALACEGLEKGNDEFLFGILDTTTSWFIDTEILLRIYLEVELDKVTNLVLLQLLRNAKPNGVNSLPFCFWEERRLEEKLTDREWITICHSYEKYYLLLKCLSLLKEWPDSNRWLRFESYVADALNDTSQGAYLLREWPTYHPSVQKGLLDFIEKNSVLSKSQYEAIFVWPALSERIKLLVCSTV